MRVGLLGFGTIGAGVYAHLRDHPERVADAGGVAVKFVRACVRDLARTRLAPQEKLTDDPMAVVRAPDVDLVVEVVGGVEPARTWVEAALRAGKDVVTANKALIAERGRELMELANAQRRTVRFEAAVGGGVPLIAIAEGHLSPVEFQGLRAIVNGTTNFILTRMETDGLAYAEALAQAQALGYAEVDPTSDVDGFDAAYKLAILATILTRAWVLPDRVERSGIRGVTLDHIRLAAAAGYRVRLVAEAESAGRGALHSLRVGPALVPCGHPLYEVSNETNAACVRCEGLGEVVVIGAGAGAGPTAASMVADIVAIARERAAGAWKPRRLPEREAQFRPSRASRILALLVAAEATPPRGAATLAAEGGWRLVTMETTQSLHEVGKKAGSPAMPVL